MRLLTLLRGELVRMFAQRGTYVGYILLGAFSGLFVWGIWAEGPPMRDVRHQFGDDFVVGGSILSGPMVPYLLLDVVPVAVNVFLPLLVSMIAGGLIAGEAQRGTLRTLLTRPVHRWAVVVAKSLAAFFHAGTLVLFLGLFSLLLGYLVFRRGDIIAVNDGLTVLAETEAVQRLALAYALTAVTMCAVAAIALFCSAVFVNPLTAAGVTVGFLIVSVALQVIPYFEWLSPYLLTTHFHAYGQVFKRTVDWAAVGTDLSYVAAYTGACLAGTLAVFVRRDMTC